ncbi:ABC transporter substrate-binding protein [Reinekea marinisedimentorum]|uniref:Spermidine/putrescine transport system substrate-binding protein n=1 Tax=Reinekea marinisedimentorum TaxID=230495 RepID=A0A4R3I6P7_9GAMM|nr:spermidine/putrescine ABC transporter substrate-binding protein [Reinekea marinisedimentorum]TCS41363.1 spermidine/putrescine transport system substrate-binding protein [Reinekea marinisedimentorum]
MCRGISLIWPALLLTAVAPVFSAESLRILTWEEYFDPQLIEQFEQQHDTSVEFIYYEYDDIRDRIMAETAGFGMDIILVDDLEMPAYASQGWLAPLQADRLFYLQGHGTLWSQLVDKAEQYAVPYSWGTYGIAYRTDLVQSPPQTWAELFNPTDEMSGFIQMPPQSSELLAIASMAFDYSLDTASQQQINELALHLVNQKPHVIAYKALDVEDSLLEQGKAKVAVSYNSDVVLLQDHTDNIEFISPTDATLMWIDFLTISSKTQNLALAHDFLNFFLKPEHVAQNMEYHYSASFSDTANAMLPDEIRLNGAVFPAAASAIKLVPAPTTAVIRSQMRLFNALDLE